MESNWLFDLWMERYCWPDAREIKEIQDVNNLPKEVLGQKICGSFAAEKLDPKRLAEKFSYFDLFFLYKSDHESTQLFRGQRHFAEEVTHNVEFPWVEGSSTSFFDIERQKVLMQLRDYNTTLFPGHYCFPGGIKAIEDIDLQATAVREFSEETGFDLKKNELAYVAKHIYFDGSSFYVVNYYALQGKMKNLVCNEGAAMDFLTRKEVGEKKLVPCADLVAEYSFRVFAIVPDNVAF